MPESIEKLACLDIKLVVKTGVCLYTVAGNASRIAQSVIILLQSLPLCTCHNFFSRQAPAIIVVIACPPSVGSDLSGKSKQRRIFISPNLGIREQRRQFIKGVAIVSLVLHLRILGVTYNQDWISVIRSPQIDIRHTIFINCAERLSVGIEQEHFKTAFPFRGIAIGTKSLCLLLTNIVSV